MDISRFLGRPGEELNILSGALLFVTYVLSFFLSISMAVLVLTRGAIGDIDA